MTRMGGPDSVITLTGSRLISTGKSGTGTQFAVFSPERQRHLYWHGTAVKLDNLKAAVALPLQLPANSEYLLWPVTAAGVGAPVTINATEAWWIGPNVATRKDTISVYGRNLTHNSAPRASHVYIQKSGSAGQWANVTAANPYKVDFTVPGNLADGSYQVWVHNGPWRPLRVERPHHLDHNDGMGVDSRCL